MKKRWGAVLLALVLTAGTVSGCGIGGKEISFQMNTLSGKYVFSVNKEKCSLKEAKVYLCNYKNIYGTVYGIDLWQEHFEEEALESYVKDVTLDELSRVFCMEQIAKEQGISLTSEESKQVEEAADFYFDSLTKEERSYMGIKKEHLVTYYTRYALACKLYETMTDGVSEEISDDEARVIRVNQIYVTEKDTANTVAGKLASGEEFQSVAHSYNEAGETERSVARNVYPKEVEEIAFNLENEEVSDMISAEDGYYFIQCISKFDEELTESNKDIIREKRERQEFEESYNDFLEDAEFALNDDVWEKLCLPEELSEITTNSFFTVYEDKMQE